MEKQTAGRDALGGFAPKFAELNDDVLFGEVWAREAELSPRDRSMITVSALISGGNFEQLGHHLGLAKENGVTKAEVAEAITHLAFYVGWPKAWSAFNLAKEVFGDDGATEDDAMPDGAAGSGSVIFPKGDLVTNGNFIGDTFLQTLVEPQAPHDTSVSNVTFSPGARNNWHVHDIGQFLLVTGGNGYYQEYGRPARRLHAGDVVNIPAGMKHWHGAAPDSWFVHIAITPGATQWKEAVDDKAYAEAVSAG